jgi:hypothetical protein
VPKLSIREALLRIRRIDLTTLPGLKTPPTGYVCRHEDEGVTIMMLKKRIEMMCDYITTKIRGLCLTCTRNGGGASCPHHEMLTECGHLDSLS